MRTFSSGGSLRNEGRIAHELGLKAAISAWLDSDLAGNEEQMQALIDVGKEGQVDLAIVGGEVLLRDDMTEDQLIAYINRVKTELPGVQVATSDSYAEMLAHPNVMAACDVVMVNIYPYWEGKSVNEAVPYLAQQYNAVVSAAGGKEVIIGETGWPSAGNRVGNAVASVPNAAKFFADFESWANANGVKSFYFEATDEKWKAQYGGTAEASFGIWYSNATMKDGMQAGFGQ
jgi:exo-beta-1,3-glucanase (GH17 family)